MVAACRDHARAVADGVYRMIAAKTTVSVERTICRLLGIDGVDDRGVPLPNVVSDYLLSESLVGDGAWYTLARIMAATGCSPIDSARRIAAGQLDVAGLPHIDAERARALLDPHLVDGIARIDDARAAREELKALYPHRSQPWLYVIVATGNIYEDTVQAKAAVAQGADIVAVIRSTAQSLLDYIPYGPTTEGFGGTYATQENFRIMRKALNESIRETGRYAQLVNYASGLCMSEIAVTGAFEGLDMMLNDSMYGILFRDINMERTFIDQHFSRMINAYADIIINTGEDNYLTTADAVDEAHTVTVSQVLNEYFAHEAGLPDPQLALGHAFEINPDVPESFRLELAHALLARELFPDALLKWMPPTKHMTGDVFRGNLLDGFFNLVGTLTDQDILLVGMMTEAVVTPWLSDRDIALQNVRYVLGAAGGLHADFVPEPGGFIQQRANRVLAEAVDLLERIVAGGLLEAIGDGTFGIMKRPADRGKGLDGVIRHAEDYYHPAIDILEGRD